MSILAILGVPLIFLGGCLTAVGVMGSVGNSYVSGFHGSVATPVHSNVQKRPHNRQNKKKMVKLGLKLFAAGVLLVAVASL